MEVVGWLRVEVDDVSTAWAGSGVGHYVDCRCRVRFSGSFGWWAGRDVQAGGGIAAMLANVAMIAVAQGQVSGIRSCRRRPV